MQLNYVCCFSLQKILGIAALDEVLDQRRVNPQNIIHNMTKVNKHGVVTLEDKTGRLKYPKKKPHKNDQTLIVIFLTGCLDSFVFYYNIVDFKRAMTHRIARADHMT